MQEEGLLSDDLIRVVDTPRDIDASAWNALLDAQASPTPFLRHEYLCALHDSRSAVPATGWHARFVCVYRAPPGPGYARPTPHGGQGNLGRPGVSLRDGALVGACVLYLKDHSYGEYVFDWAWAEAYQRHGLRYYPKLLGAVPFTPVPGTRLMAADPATRALLLQVLPQLARELGASSVHLLFLDDADRQAVRAAGPEAGWMLRRGVQFHWQDPDSAADPGCATRRWPNFEAFLASLQRDKRKKIQQERRRVAEAGVTFSALEAEAIETADWDFFHRCYQATYQAHHSTPYLSRDFFTRMAQCMPRYWLMFTAWRGGQRIAASLVAIDAAQGVAHGRYWGAVEHVPCLHFEACYYQPLIWCMSRGYRRFEGGAQGEHKMARGLLPVETASAHWLANPEFAQAVADFLSREGAGVADYIDELGEHQPFKRTGGGTTGDGCGTAEGAAGPW
jgi:uncharacterized protein